MRSVGDNAVVFLFFNNDPSIVQDMNLGIFSVETMGVHNPELWP